MLVNDLKPNKEYIEIDGSPEFQSAAASVLLGEDHPLLSTGRLVTAQTISGTGALHVLGEFIKRFCKAPIYISDPSWVNHEDMFDVMGLETRKYRYFDKETRGLDFPGMIEDLKVIPPGSWLLLHTCAHNPSGVDPTEE